MNERLVEYNQTTEDIFSLFIHEKIWRNFQSWSVHSGSAQFDQQATEEPFRKTVLRVWSS